MLSSVLSVFGDRLDAKFLMAYWLPGFAFVLGRTAPPPASEMGTHENALPPPEAALTGMRYPFRAASLA